jgi:hypothetical protein
MARTLLIAKTMPAQNSSKNCASWTHARIMPTKNRSKNCASWTQANNVPTIPDQNQGLLHGPNFANSKNRTNMRQGKNRASWKYTVQNHIPPESI